MEVYLAATPQELREVRRLSVGVAHVAYRIGRSCLLRQELPLNVRGGLLSLSDRDAPAITDPERLAVQILRECSQRNYSGITADFEQPPSTDRITLLRALLRRGGKGLRLFVPESCAVEGASVLINTAVSGGSLAEHLQESIRRFPGASLDLQRLMMDFTLPSPSGEGTPLSADELAALRQNHGPAVFFSPELCARYFTYRENGQVHFVLFDNAGTMRQKMNLAASLGYRASLVMYPEIRDIAEQLFPAGKTGA